MKVREVMSSAVHTCKPQDSLHRVAALLWEHDIGMLPVVNGDGRVGAVITDRDACMAACTRGAALAELRVADAMSRSLVVCGPDDDLEVAARAMIQHQVHRLPVVDDDERPCGVLALNDLALATREDAKVGKIAMKVLVAVSQHRSEVPAVVETGAKGDASASA